MVDRVQFTELWMEYFMSTTKEAKGNYLFGLPEN